MKVAAINQLLFKAKAAFTGGTACQNRDYLGGREGQQLGGDLRGPMLAHLI